MASERPGRVKSSTYFDAAQQAWLEAEAKRLDRTVNWVLRQLVQAAMDAERKESVA